MMIDLKESLNLNLKKILHSMKYYISESRLEILMKKKNMMLKNFEKRMIQKKEEQYTIPKNNS